MAQRCAERASFRDLWLTYVDSPLKLNHSMLTAGRCVQEDRYAQYKKLNASLPKSVAFICAVELSCEGALVLLIQCM
jgi:hypothetical protein